jgi:RNA polymerase sigma-70 factor, ECF subfamily
VALAQTAGPSAALEAIEALELHGYQYFHAARADFLRRLGRRAEAREAYERALELARSDPERRFLAGRLSELEREP